MSDLLGIGTSGLSSYRSALSTVSDNVVNANTPGYVRREARLAAATPTSGVDPYYLDRSSAGGVRTAGIVRATDPFRVEDGRLTAADAARADARAQWLALAEEQLPDGDGGVGARLTAVYTAADALAADPDGALPRQAMTTALDDAAAALRNGAAGLARVSAGIGTAATDAVGGLNANLAALDKVNTTLRRLQDGSVAKAEALDERDRLLDGIAATLGVDVAYERSGAASVSVAGAGGTVLLDPRGAAPVSLAAATDGRLSLTMVRDGVTSAIAPTAGALAGLVDGAANVAGRRRQLDGLATDFAAQVNDWNKAGRRADGGAGEALMAATGAADIRLLADDPAALAAADATSANGNALALAGRRGAGGIEARAAALVSGLQQGVAAAKAESTAATSRADASAAARDAVSGVDLDREAAELIRFQQAYDGSAKIIQVSRETLQSILQLF